MTLAKSSNKLTLREAVSIPKIITVNINRRDSAAFSKGIIEIIKESLCNISLLRVALLTIAVVSSGMAIQWDRYRLYKDFENVMSLLRSVWMETGVNNTQLIVKFGKERIDVSFGDTGNIYAALDVPTLHKVNYDTTLGENMIVYTGVGTARHNMRSAGGGFTLRSWLGIDKDITVNGNGLALEGRHY